MTTATGMDWDDLKLVLVLSRGETLSAAARVLGVNQTTVSRRLEAAERRLGAAAFDRLDGHLSLTELGEALVRHAERMEEEALAASHAALQGQTLSGTVRITAVDSLLSCLVVPHIPDLYRMYPALRLDLAGSQTNANLHRREADIALRLAMPAPGAGSAGLVVRKLMELEVAVYGKAGTDPERLPWLGYEDALRDIPESRWLGDVLAADQHPDSAGQVALQASSASLLLRAVECGLGRAVLPCIVGDRGNGVRRLGRPVLSRPVWMVVQEDVLRSRRVRTVADWLIACLGRDDVY